MKQTKSKPNYAPAKHLPQPSSKRSGNYKIFPTKVFLSEARRLHKKYPGIKQDFLDLKDVLKKTPCIGDPLGGDIFKIRMDITDKSKGKSGSARVYIRVDEEEKQVFVLRTHEKGTISTIITDMFKKQVKRGNI